MAAQIYPLTVEQELENVRHDSLDVLKKKFATMQCTTQNAAPHLYITALPESEQTVGLRICLLVYYVTKGQEIPKLLQVQATIASIARNTLVVAGTGFGKTQIMAALMLLEKSSSQRVFITISPLNRLQVTQVRRASYMESKQLTEHPFRSSVSIICLDAPVDHEYNPRIY